MTRFVASGIIMLLSFSSCFVAPIDRVKGRIRKDQRTFHCTHSVGTSAGQPQRDMLDCCSARPATCCSSIATCSDGLPINQGTITASAEWNTPSPFPVPTLGMKVRHAVQNLLDERCCVLLCVVALLSHPAGMPVYV